MGNEVHFLHEMNIKSFLQVDSISLDMCNQAWQKYQK